MYTVVNGVVYTSHNVRPVYVCQSTTYTILDECIVQLKKRNIECIKADMLARKYSIATAKGNKKEMNRLSKEIEQLLK